MKHGQIFQPTSKPYCFLYLINSRVHVTLTKTKSVRKTINSELKLDIQTFTNISKIIERDSKVTTYKFALLRGVIDIIQDASPYIKIGENTVTMPIGLLVEKWLIYYYPILNSDILIPQSFRGNKLAFYESFIRVINYYNSYNGVSELYNNLRRNGISPEIKTEFIELIKNLKDTISKMPMRYIGKSVTNQEYSIFQVIQPRKKYSSDKIDLQWLINSCGEFSIPREYYDAFKVLGSFISGTDSILFKWADFSVNASGKNLDTEKVISEILKSPITDREIRASRDLYNDILAKAGQVFCVWTGEPTNKYHIDHMIPFSVFKNNDLWNLLPVLPSVNSNKSDKIPSSLILNKRKDLIIHYWEVIKEFQENRFLSELQVALLGTKNQSNWQEDAFNQLKLTCSNLINVRGYEAWTPQG